MYEYAALARKSVRTQTEQGYNNELAARSEAERAKGGTSERISLVTEILGGPQAETVKEEQFNPIRMSAQTIVECAKSGFFFHRARRILFCQAQKRMGGAFPSASPIQPLPS